MVCDEEMGICIDDEGLIPCENNEDCPPGMVCDKETSFCIDDEDMLCPLCPNINPLILTKIEELEGYMDTLNEDLIILLSTKEPIKEDLYNLYKVVMLKSLGYQKVVNYIDFLTERLYYETMEVGLVTDSEEVNIGSYSWSWTKWLFNILYSIDSDKGVVTENDPATFFLKKPMSDTIIEDALRLAQEAKQNDIQSLGKDAVGDIQEGNQSLIYKFISFVKETFIKVKERVVLTREVLAQTEVEKTIVCNCVCSSVCTILNCNIQEIEKENEEILKIREKMTTAKENLHNLTYKFLNTPTENVCDPLNIDIRVGEEKNFCLNNTTKNIKKHELILRKLHHARSQFDVCQNFNISAVLAGETTSKNNIFGSIAEQML